MKVTFVTQISNKLKIQMKKITTTIFALMMTVIVMGQTRTLQTVSYRGAFEPGVTAWTNGWTNFDPQTKLTLSSGNLTSKLQELLLLLLLGVQIKLTLLLDLFM
jgi:hypothetical protein